MALVGAVGAEAGLAVAGHAPTRESCRSSCGSSLAPRSHSRGDPHEDLAHDDDAEGCRGRSCHRSGVLRERLAALRREVIQALVAQVVPVLHVRPTLTTALGLRPAQGLLGIPLRDEAALAPQARRVTCRTDFTLLLPSSWPRSPSGGACPCASSPDRSLSRALRAGTQTLHSSWWSRCTSGRTRPSRRRPRWRTGPGRPSPPSRPPGQSSRPPAGE